jgi:hypothetical protein
MMAMMTMSSPHADYTVGPSLSHDPYSGGGPAMMGSPVMPQSPPALLPTSPASPLSGGSVAGEFGSPLVAAKQMPDPFLDNNPGYFPGADLGGRLLHPPAPPPLVWEPELAIQPHPPAYDECYAHPPAASSLYGQDLRFSYNNYH